MDGWAGDHFGFFPLLPQNNAAATALRGGAVHHTVFVVVYII
jgi:hypothetical protein